MEDRDYYAEVRDIIEDWIHDRGEYLTIKRQVLEMTDDCYEEYLTEQGFKPLSKQ